jgi:hypothetical protein
LINKAMEQEIWKKPFENLTSMDENGRSWKNTVNMNINHT